MLQSFPSSVYLLRVTPKGSLVERGSRIQLSQWEGNGSFMFILTHREGAASEFQAEGCHEKKDTGSLFREADG